MSPLCGQSPPQQSRRRKAAAVSAVLVLLVVSLSGCLGIERSEWAFQLTQIAELQDNGLSGQGVRIGIVDSGIDLSHPALSHVHLVAWMDFVGDHDEPYDDSGHGTHVAGILAAHPSSGQWFAGGNVKGVSPGVDLIVVKACGPEQCSSSSVEEGIDFTVQKGADIVVLSLGGRQALANLGDAPIRAVERATDSGVFVTAAAGNSDTQHGDVESPASARYAIAVGAINEDERVADFSSRGSNSANQGLVAAINERPDPHKKPELVAPGVAILSTWLDGGYAHATGTSQSTPFVAGVIALLLEDQPQWKRSGDRGGSLSSVETMKQVLTESAKPLDGYRNPHDNAAGYGLVQAVDALKQLEAE